MRWFGSMLVLSDVDLSFLSFILFIAIIASMVQLVEMVVEKFSPALYSSLGIFFAAYRCKLRYLRWIIIYAGTRIPIIGSSY